MLMIKRTTGRASRGSRSGWMLVVGLAGTLSALPCTGARADAVADGIAKAKEVLVPFQMKAPFSAPGPDFDARKCAQGKKILAMPNTSANPFLKGIIDREIAAGAVVGLRVREWQNLGLPSQWVQGFEQAIRDKYDIVDLVSSIDPQTLRPQVKAASEAGVKVMTTHFYDPTMKQDPLVSSSLTLDYGEVGKILANWTAANLDGAANVVLVTMNEVPTALPLVAAIKAGLAANCPNCKVAQEINVGVTEWATKIQPAV
ncbi:substrate-binding domain-containing protein [Bradyrhizobium sp. 41S5]|uniref:sugar ABC transporter substrate-binding protein n=1 Tax=Bradyrhizobium sp. 41S5 TaxID=1404443 RepID=UPI001AEE0F0E|nr:substrate-binding domain-containing protein [Bradyrhizobium sp. 41S5]UFX42751.1 substrate-binding domain-containing protein [Bradyrhizobium sp. 41S5]